MNQHPDLERCLKGFSDICPLDTCPLSSYQPGTVSGDEHLLQEDTYPPDNCSLESCSQHAELYAYNAFLTFSYILLSHAFDNSFLHILSYYATLTEIKTTLCIGGRQKVVFVYNSRFFFLEYSSLVFYYK